jgi:hypothetical protein
MTRQNKLVDQSENNEDEQEVEDQRRPRKKETNEERATRLDKERRQLQASLAAGDFSTQIVRVASILNVYPNTRNSDVLLTLKYWETYQSEIYDERGIRPVDLFKLERFHLIVRARAKIQNEYGLFQADEHVRRRRRSNEESMRDEVIQQPAPTRKVRVFADETGKTQARSMVSSVWILEPYEEFKISVAITSWRKSSGWGKREIHFSRFGANDFAQVQTLLDVVNRHRAFISFKVIGVRNAGSPRTAEERVARLHSSLIVRGMEHEIASGRLDLPREVEVAIDADNALDDFAVDLIQERVAAGFARTFPDGSVRLAALGKVESRSSELVQLADLIGGAINRRVHPQAERGPKDDLADLIIERLELAIPDEDTDEDVAQDASTVLSVARNTAPRVDP